MASTAFRVPVVSQAELDFFRDAHFGKASIDHFSTHFLPSHDAQHDEQSGQFYQPEEAYDDEDQEDDGLGYYEDGVKRTLTDEQIAMFRHSELEALRRAQESGDSKPATASSTAAAIKTSPPTREPEPRELSSEDDIPSKTAKTAGKKKKRRRPKTRVEPEKPDLRKRTWDVVDTGLASLDYGEEPQGSTPIPRQTQRRRISYDD